MSEKFDTRQTLIDRVRYGGDDEAWDEFAEIYREYVYMVVRRMGLEHHDAMDVVQDVMLVLYKKLPALKLGGEAPSFRQWLSTVTKNAALSLLRSAKRRTLREEQSQLTQHGDALENGQADVYGIMQREWEVFLCNKALERIRNRFSTKAVAAFESSLNNEPAAEVADRLGLTINSVYQLRGRIKQRLAEEVRHLAVELEPQS